jgi:formylglycine-generating enzyme required for sulfatase activity
MRQTFYRSVIILLWLLAAPALPAFTSERPPSGYTDPVTGMEFMAIPGGTFVMGDNQDESALPAHEVTVKPFLLGR